MPLDLMFQDHNPATPLSGARLTLLVAAVNEALGVPDASLAGRIDDAESDTRAALDRVMVKVPRGERWANVQDYLDPERIPGTTDDRPAFQAAIATGRPVYAPADTYYFSRSADWGSGAVLAGDGKGRTVLKLLDTALADAVLVCNSSLNGTVNGYFSDFTMDGNAGRQGGTLVAAGGSRSSNMCFRNVAHFYVDRVSSVNSVQHGFDVTWGGLDYAYLGDGSLAPKRSTDVHYDQCDASGFGDDAFTSHSADHVTWSRCIGFDPRLRGNCNAFEIDGDSRHWTMTGNRSYGCYAGIEVKGHGSESAAIDGIINGHRDIGSVRSYNFRHIGYHSGADPVSTTAKNILASNLVSINPNNDKGFQDDATPRALSISAYSGVTVVGATFVGRGDHADGHIAVAIQFRASDINLSGISISNWVGAEVDLSITSGDRVNVSGLTIRNSARTGIYTGSTVTAVNIHGVIASAPLTGPIGNGADFYNTTGVTASGMSFTGYPVPVRADLANYASVALFNRRIRNVPAGVTRLIDLDPVHDYYASTGVMGAMTDGPGLGGANIIEHSRVAGDVYTQTSTRNTTGATIQGRAWRVCYTNLTSGPWNRESVNDMVPIAGILPAGGTPPVGAAVGSVWLVRS